MAKTKSTIKYRVFNKKGETIIEKTGMVEEFTLTELNDVLAYNNKLKVEAESTLSIREAEKQNIEDNYPKIKEMTEEEIFRVAMYHQKVTDIKAYKDKLSEIYKKITEQNNVKKIALVAAKPVKFK